MIYRYGNSGFLGVGGTWNLNEEKNPDAEIIASGVFVGFFIYTSVILISYCFGTTSQKHSPVVSRINLLWHILFSIIKSIHKPSCSTNSNYYQYISMYNILINWWVNDHKHNNILHIIIFVISLYYTKYLYKWNNVFSVHWYNFV